MTAVASDLSRAADLVEQAVRAEWLGAYESSQALYANACTLYLRAVHTAKAEECWPLFADWSMWLREGLRAAWAREAA